MKKDYDVVVFDLDGTMLDTSRGVINCVQYALEKLGFEKLPMETARRFVGPPLHAAFIEFVGMDEETAHKAVATYRERYAPVGVLECVAYPGILSLIRDIKAAGKKIAVATGKPEKFARICLGKEGIMECVDFITTPELTDTKDIKPLLVKRCLDRLGENAVMIGDRDLDINGAQENHIDSIGVTYGFGAAEEFTGATYIAENVEEIRKILL